MRNQTRNKSNSTQQKQVYILYTDPFHVKKYQQGQIQPKKLTSVIIITQGEISLFLLNYITILVAKYHFLSLSDLKKVAAANNS